MIAINVNNLQETFLEVPEMYDWLWDRKPLATAGDSIWLFDITGDAEAHARLRAIYQAAGLHGLATAEAEKLKAAAGQPHR